jgi:FKBP-type peptidyl-prolyl cis-trans isomerase FkpA
MKHLLLVTGVLVMLLSGCVKKEQGCTPVSPSAEEPQITAYASANGITAVKHSSGIYYQIIDSGTGATPTLTSKVYINYVGKLLNGTTFDQSDNPANTGWTLGSLIEGWQIGLPLIKKGGKIKLIIPSSLAYGCNGAGNTIPPNAVLYFYIELVDVQ